MFMPQKKRRGRKRKIDKLLEAAQAVAAEKMAQAQLAAVESAMAKQVKGLLWCFTFNYLKDLLGILCLKHNIVYVFYVYS